MGVRHSAVVWKTNGVTNTFEFGGGGGSGGLKLGWKSMIYLLNRWAGVWQCVRRQMMVQTPLAAGGIKVIAGCIITQPQTGLPATRVHCTPPSHKYTHKQIHKYTITNTRIVGKYKGDFGMNHHPTTDRVSSNTCTTTWHKYTCTEIHKYINIDTNTYGWQQ